MEPGYGILKHDEGIDLMPGNIELSGLEVSLLGRQYRHYMRMRVESVLELTHLLDYTMPGIKTLLKGWNETNGNQNADRDGYPAC